MRLHKMIANDIPASDEGVLPSGHHCVGDGLEEYLFCELVQVGLVVAIGRASGLVLEMVFPHAT
ncbi:hypothetical protein GCM10007927_28690 [Sulfitobacter pacificus]|uniref:Uncharacterized protein n=1 Tax=Sulfitobacter pacificus TaxID=1499314 RepID=A0ABQ5VLX7_9RHOB|nr:hypothetical protein GCM10007927_28690 [Sulfitobacter pacificus]